MENELLKRYLKKSILLKRLMRWLRARRGGYPDWFQIIREDKTIWENTLNQSKNGPKVLIATSVGSFLPGTTLESLLSVALTLRGADVHVLLCDSFLPACLESLVTWYPDQSRFLRYGPKKDLCKDCFWPADRMYRSLGFVIHKYSEFVTAEEIEMADRLSSEILYADIGQYKLESLAVGEHALAGALRFYARGTLDGEPQGEAILRQYLKASLLTTYAMRRLLGKMSYTCSTFHHGIYIPQGLIGEVARQEKVRVVNWNPAYRKKCFIFSHGETYHHTLMSEPVSKWENIQWTPEMEKEVMDYLKSRWYGTNDWIWFHEKPQENLQIIAREIGVDFSRPCIGMLTNVIWDAQLHYPANAFPSMLEWITQTMRYFSKRPELQLLIRVHPAEIRGTIPSRQPVVDEIKKVFPVLPDNIYIIPPESPVSTYAAMSQCNAAIIYGTKTGVELSSMGIPVIVAGEAWVRNKGITMDAISVEDYFKLLDKLPLKQGLDKEAIQRARKYAYHFFFRRMIPLEFMEPTGRNPPYSLKVTRLEELLPGHSPGLDVICDGILKGTDFIFKAEQYA